MNNKKGFTLVELLSVIVILAIIIGIASFTYGKIRLSVNQKNYENKVNLIEVAASKFADDTNITAVYIDDLIKNGYLDADNQNGDLINPIDNTRLNCYIVQTTDKNGIYYSELLNENYEVNGECPANIPNNISEQLKIAMYDGNVGNVLKYNDESQWWTINDVILKAEVSEEIEIQDIQWYEGYSNEPISKENNGFIISEVSNDNYLYYKVSANPEELVQQNYTVKIQTTDGKKLATTVRVYIDKVKPQFYSKDAEKINEIWEVYKIYYIKAYDNESGLYGYKILDNTGECPTSKTEYKRSSKNKITENGIYKVCIIDNVGNINEKEIEVNRIDNVPMSCTFNVTGTLGNVVNGNQWYKSNVDVTLKADRVGPSGVSLGIRENSDVETYETNYILDLESAKITKNYGQTSGKTIYGYVKNQAKRVDGYTQNKCSVPIHVETSITAPNYLYPSSNHTKIEAYFTSGEAISGLNTSKTRCYLTYSDGTIKSTGTVSGNNCVFNVDSSKYNTTYYFKKCIESKAGNTTCSSVSSAQNVGYCESGYYYTVPSSSTCGSCQGTCGTGIKNCSYYEYGYSYYNGSYCNTSGPYLKYESCTLDPCEEPEPDPTPTPIPPPTNSCSSTRAVTTESSCQGTCGTGTKTVTIKYYSTTTGEYCSQTQSTKSCTLDPCQTCKDYSITVTNAGSACNDSSKGWAINPSTIEKGTINLDKYKTLEYSISSSSSPIANSLGVRCYLDFEQSSNKVTKALIDNSNGSKGTLKISSWKNKNGVSGKGNLYFRGYGTATDLKYCVGQAAKCVFKVSFCD